MTERFNIIYADPAWKYASRGMYQETFPKRKQIRRPQNVAEKYSVMEKEEIKKLPVGTLADRDCALFLWTTDSHLPDAIEIMRAWGFKYRAIAFIWIKRSSKGKLCANVGAWTMKNAEICLIGVRGNMMKHKIRNNIYQIIDCERGDHSEKPSEARKRIVDIFGDLPRIELFARKRVDGWHAWGNEIQSDAVAL